MSLDGLRAWIGEVERKLGMRTRVFLVLSVIAIGGAAAAIYLAANASDDAVSESDVQALQQQLETQIGEAGGASAASSVTQLEAELGALRTEVEQLSAGNGKEGNGGGANGGPGGASASPEEGGEAGAAGANSEAGAQGGGSGTSGTTSSGKAKPGKVLQQAEDALESSSGQDDSSQIP